MAVSKRLRFEIFRRDGFRCKYCGLTAGESELHVDHVLPKTLGGQDEASNLVTACKDCNAGKSSIPADSSIAEEVSDHALKFAEAVRQVTEIRAREIASRRELTRWLMKKWNAWTNWRGDTYDTEGDELQSIPQFVSMGLTKEDLEELIGVAMRSQAKEKWRYFCGCCWRRIKETQTLAKDLIDTQSAPERLHTVWTLAEIDENTALSEAYARNHLSQDSIASAYCPHREWGQGSCADPVCRVMVSEGLSTMAYSKDLAAERLERRETALMDELDRLEDVDA